MFHVGFNQVFYFYSSIKCCPIQVFLLVLFKILYERTSNNRLIDYAHPQASPVILKPLGQECLFLWQVWPGEMVAIINEVDLSSDSLPNKAKDLRDNRQKGSRLFFPLFTPTWVINSHLLQANELRMSKVVPMRAIPTYH